MAARTRVVVESGDKRVLVTAIDWPGWSRGGKSRDEALATLVEYGARYRKTLGAAAKELTVPDGTDALEVIATPAGGSSTDYGVPGAIVDPDREPLTEAGLATQIKLLKGAWRAFDKTVVLARGRELAKGPRGGGRSLDKIVEHVREAERSAYINQLGAKPPAETTDMAAVHAAFVEALHAKLRGELPEKGPRGGDRWPARYAIRRAAWHVLDHTWEIEDRLS